MGETVTVARRDVEIVLRLLAAGLNGLPLKAEYVAATWVAEAGVDGEETDAALTRLMDALEGKE